ncbi:hypothetical protein NQ315_004102 [Exocentrus adspersus]|uniref:Unc-50-like protein n=1 Tax=Exocentrus adspersus TaxID=1586481 RepID=A0AAV8W768_9CUCU|nr:hypothetical protein NQ315_004102 [Exocentrus adspersus]
MSYSDMRYSVSQCSISTAYSKCVRYTRRIFKYDQMDFQFALWQMLYLFVSPQKLMKMFQTRKYTKSQYARDDPAFLVLFSGVLCLSSIGVSFVLNLSFVQFIKFLFFVVFIDAIGVGLVLATVLWYLTNTFLKPQNHLQDIEWGFSLDMHFNAFFPPLILLHVIHWLINHNTYLSVFFGNAFWLCAAFYYAYISFLGYNSLQILKHTKVFLAPIPWFILLYLISSLIRWNVSDALMTFYKYRVL